MAYNGHSDGKMKIILIHQDAIQHYRVAVYNYLYQFLKMHNYELCVVSGGIEEGNTRHIEFNYKQIELKTCNIVKIIKQVNPDAIIFFVNLKNLYLFPVLFYSKLKKIKAIYWGHGRDLENKKSIKNVVYFLEHWIADSIILYSYFLLKFVSKRFHYKVFIANNTLNTIGYDHIVFDKFKTLKKFNIRTSKNIICVGRMQKRKRIEDLIKAFKSLRYKDIGLILVGPDTDGILNNIEDNNIYKLGAVYGEDTIKLLMASDVYCLPGHVGLSIVDAFYCGLPLVTEDVDHAPEISYFKDGVNGFMVPKGDILELSQKLRTLLTNEVFRKNISNAARKTIQTDGHISNMCKGFREALDYLFQ